MKSEMYKVINNKLLFFSVLLEEITKKINTISQTDAYIWNDMIKPTKNKHKKKTVYWLKCFLVYIAHTNLPTFFMNH